MKDYRLIVGASIITGLVLSFAPEIGAQGDSGSGGAAQSNSTPQAGTPVTGSNSAEIAIENTALQTTGQPLGDYVPCEFSTVELMRLRPAPVAIRLTDADSEALKQDVIAVARTQQIGSSAAMDSYLDNFIQAISGEHFGGKSQTESLETIMADYEATVKNPTADQKDFAIKAELKSLNISSSQTVPVAASDAAVAAPAPGQEATIVDTARQATAAFLQPQDVACAMTILTYVEAREAYGTLVAKNYIAVQINVRNLNISQDFQIHDAELAVDSDPSGRHGRYFSGSDKRVVRAFAVAQQSFDARNLTVNITQGAGALLNTIVPLVGGTFADAVGVITGGAIPGLAKTWKDSTTDQLNLLSDTAYSPGTNGTSVPRNSVVQFMMFVPSRPFEQGWWTLDCANQVYLASKNDSGYLGSNRESGLSGVDVDRQLEPCLDAAGQSASDASGSSITPYTISRGTGEPKSDVFANPVPLPYKKWSGSMLGIFRELALTAVSGVHTVEASQLAANISNLKCQPAFDKQGNMTFDGTNPIACVVTGQNLGSIKTLRLRNADAPSDSSDYAFQPTSGDPTSGTVNFDATKLAALKGAAYTVFMVDASNTETKTSLALNFITTVNPVLLKIGSGAASVDIAQSTPASITIYGSHLDGIGKISLTSKSDSTINDSITPSQTSAFSIVFDLSKATTIIAKATSTPITISVSLQPSATGAQLVVTSLTFPVIKSH